MSADPLAWDAILATAKTHYDAHDDPAHDWAHAERVIAWARRLGEAEGADWAVLGPAAALHDVVNVPKNAPDRAHASARAGEAAVQILAPLGYGSEDVARIAVVIGEHSWSAGRAPSSVEAACLQDADRLDAVGAVGVARTFTVGKALGAAYYDRADPWAEHRDLDDRAFTLDHFKAKLLRLAASMNTAAGRAEAERRSAFMRAFLDQWRAEIAMEARLDALCD